jgi:hypothetical protein
VLSSSGQIKYDYRPVSVAAVGFAKYVKPTFTACDVIDFGDAVSLSWAVAAVWLSAYAIKTIRRGLHV